jgi:CheY-like chemotaxis protein
VLVIDDNASVRSAIVAYLRLGGHTVTEADRGDAGVRAFAATAVDLVVTDLEMPGLIGWEVARAVRTRRPTVPVVLITGDADAVKAEPSLRALVDAILLKPFGPRALLEVIRGLTMPGRSEEVPEPTEPGAGVPDPGASRQLSVLLVEDNPGDATLIRELLRDHPGVRIVAVDTLARALTQLADPTTDLVLLDLGLPDSQGVDTVARVVHEHPALPVIVVTGHEDAALAQATATAGAADYLVKGAMEPAQLLRAIQAASARKRRLGEGHAPS